MSRIALDTTGTAVDRVETAGGTCGCYGTTTIPVPTTVPETTTSIAPTTTAPTTTKPIATTTLAPTTTVANVQGTVVTPAPEIPQDVTPSYTGSNSTLLALWAMAFLLIGCGIFGLAGTRRRPDATIW